MKASGAPLEYRPDIDGLRALAVLLVMGFHAFPGRVPGGFIGVDVFFVISGYLISGLILRDLSLGSFRVWNFYARRARRIFPALVVVLITCLVVGRLMLAPSEFVELGLNTAGSAAFVANVTHWAQSGYFTPASESKPLLHLWSLGVEEQFYLAWPLTLAFLFRKSRQLRPPVAAIAAASFALSVYLTSSRPELAFYGPATRLWELLIGALLACPADSGDSGATASRTSPGPRAGRYSDIASALGLALVTASAFALDGSQAFPGWRAGVPVLGTALTIAAGPHAWCNRVLLARPLPVSVGLISYPLYLWHWPFLVLVPLLDVAYSSNEQRVVKLLALAAATAAAYWTYRFVERPVRLAKRGSIASLCLAMLVPLFGGLGVAGMGYRDRLPTNRQQREIVSAIEALQQQRAELFRDRRCCLAADQDAGSFSSECVSEAENRPSEAILLWGDSHAAHLAPGMRTSGAQSGLAQLTATSCPPIVGYAARGRPHCASINRWVMDWVKTHRPGTILLAASWHSYDGYQTLSGTIAALKALGTPRVVVVGPFPSFRERVSEVLARESTEDSVPERLPNSRLPRLRRVDSELRSIAAAAGAEFVSPLALLCGERDCLVSPEGTAAGILVFDQSHLTPAGSGYVVNALLLPLLRWPAP